MKQKEIHVRQRQYCNPNISLTIASMAACSAVAVAEMWFITVRQFFGFRLVYGISSLLRACEQTSQSNLLHLFTGTKQRRVSLAES